MNEGSINEELSSEALTQKIEDLRAQIRAVGAIQTNLSRQLSLAEICLNLKTNTDGDWVSDNSIKSVM